MACRELDADAALLSEIRDGREHVRWARGRGRLRRRARSRCATRSASGCWTGAIGSIVADTTRRAGAERAGGGRDGDVARLHRRAVQDRGRARLRALLPGARGAAGPRGGRRALPAGPGGEPAAGARVLVSAAASLAAAVLAAGCGGERRRRDGRAAPSGAACGCRRSALRRAGVRHRAARRQAAACSWSSRAARSGSCDGGKTLGTPFLDISDLDQRRAASRACCRWPSRPTTRRAGCSTSTTPTTTATQRVVEYKRAQRRRGRPGLRAPGAAASADPRPTTTAACCCSGPTSCSTSALGDGGGGGDQHGARGNGQNLGTLLGKILRIDPRPSGSRPYTVPSDNPFVGRAGAQRRDLQLRPAQPVAVLVRPPDRRPDDRRRRPGRGRGDRLRAQGHGRAARTSAGACSRATSATRDGETRARARSSR